MKPADQAFKPSCDPTVFTVRLEGRVYRCALSDDALYLLSQQVDPRLDRIDAYLLLKRRVADATRACLENDADGLPSLMEARHVMRHG